MKPKDFNRPVNLDGDVVDDLVSEFGRADAQAALSQLAQLDDGAGSPAGLGDRTIAFVRRQSLLKSAAIADTNSSRRGFWPSRLDVAVAACMMLLLTGLSLGGLGRLNQNYSLQACRNNLFHLFTGLDVYASSHDGRYPELNAQSDHAGSFVKILAREGLLDSQMSVGCPAVRLAAAPVSEDLDYTYSLGTRGPDGQVHGLSRKYDLDANTMPILADRPLSGWVPRPSQGNHNDGSNVLFVSGSVRYCTTPTVGWNGDHIYLNAERRVAAGLHAHDAVLGEKDDRP